jgi:hypothetical protein
MFFSTLKQIRRLIVAVVGFTVLLIGAAMVVLPGPATLVIPLGLAILATEFMWARNLLHRMKEQLKKVTKKKEVEDGVETERPGRGVLREAGVREKEEDRGGKAEQAGR